ncbi:MAG TPA: ATP-binding protein [Bryobacteraceae bacterium]|nr:ATP-binding protein [Bryobacteraceae bacterium]
MRGSAEERITSRNVDLSNCDREQIQFSNAVQPHCVLLAMDPATWRILQVSGNADELGFGPARDLPGRRLQDVFTPSDYQCVSDAARKLRYPAPPLHIGSSTLGGQTRDLFIHINNGSLFLEAERQGAHPGVAQKQLYDELRNGIAQLNASTSVVGFLDQAVHVIARCTGFERVMAYRFHGDGSGEVVAEAVHQGLERYLGLHYPAADIPKPARRLFALTWLRHLPDVNYQPVPLIPEINPVTSDLADLSYVFSRSVSVMYTEYLRNMGVKATMVLTLFKGGKLWGLISCMQHSAPRHLNIEVRAVCEMLAQTSSLLMSAKEDAEFAKYRESLSHSLEALVHQLGLRTSTAEALSSPKVNLLSAMDASGAAIFLGETITLLGQTPSQSAVQALAAAIASKVQPVWSSDLATRDVAMDDETASRASGILATRIGQFDTDLVIWFRPEYRQTVAWAGDPEKLVVRAPGREARLNPNGSFDVWRTEVRGRSKPWLECELDFASRLGRVILEVVVQRSREMARLNQDLSRSNRELEEFVYTASHDLKSPLRGIATYAQMVLRTAADLPSVNRERLQSIVQLANRMDGVIEGLLRYSELGHAVIRREDVDLNEVCEQIIELLRVDIESTRTEIRIPRRLPILRCDLRWVTQILLNLMANGIKYNDKEKRTLEIGYLVPPASTVTGRTGPGILYVKDNGIGIAPDDRDAVLRLFHRLHADQKYGAGTGLGLSIVARSVERHNGRLWIESTVGEGSTFFFTLDE